MRPIVYAASESYQDSAPLGIDAQTADLWSVPKLEQTKLTTG